jgi:hypothetical protein
VKVKNNFGTSHHNITGASLQVVSVAVVHTYGRQMNEERCVPATQTSYYQI